MRRALTLALLLAAADAGLRIGKPSGAGALKMATREEEKKAKSRKLTKDEDLAESTRAAMAAEAARRQASNQISPAKQKPKAGSSSF